MHLFKNFFSTSLYLCTLALGGAALAPTVAKAQQSRIYTDPDHTFKTAQELFQQEKYGVAMQLFNEVIHEIGYFQETGRSLVNADAHYYYTVCALKLQNNNAEKLALDYLATFNNNAREQLVSYNLARYYFHRNELKAAIPFYEKAGIDNLSNNEIADAKFELAYCYFYTQDFKKALPLFVQIKEIKGKYYIPANYYYGFIAYGNRQYDDALQSFSRVVDDPKYHKVVPYYIAEIYYYQGNRDKVISYVTPLVEKGDNYYDAELKALLGRSYFEKGDYHKSLPYLQQYQDNADTVSKEDVYQLSYAYYQTGNLQKAITGFKQLSDEKDSLGQNSMYLLGDCYLRTGQKANARNAFAFCARNSSNPQQQEISRFNYGKLSYELGYSDAALSELNNFVKAYPNSTNNKEAREILANLFLHTNNFKEALSTIEGIQDKSPNVLKAYQTVAYGRATELINDGQLDDADHLLDIAINNNYDPKTKQLAQFWKGEIALRQQQQDAAITHLQAYLAGTPPISGEANVQTASYDMGYGLLKKENYSGALPYFEAAQRASGPNAGRIGNDAVLRTADCYYMLRDFPKATALYDKVISSNQPGADYALYQKSVILGLQGKQNDKLNLLKQLGSKYPTSDYGNDVDMEIANTYLSQEKYTEAIPYLENVVTKQPNGPNTPKALLKLGLSYFNKDNDAKALSYYQQVVTKFPDAPEANEALQSIRSIYVSQGKADDYMAFLKSTGKTVSTGTADSITYATAENRFSSGDYPGAIAAFNTYIQQFPNGQFIVPANFYKAEGAYNSKDYTTALPAYEFVLSKNAPQYAERAALQAGNIQFYQNKDYSKARSYYLQLQDLSTSKENTLTATRGLLRSNYQLQHWDEVGNYAEILLATAGITPDDQVTGHFYLGKARQQANQYDDAIASYKTVAGLTKNEIGAEARYNMGVCLLAQQKLDDAEKAGFDVIKNTPSYDRWVAKAYILLGDVYTAEKDYFNAKATYQSMADNCPIPELKQEAREKLNKVEATEKAESKIKKP
ncbi:Tetratricopeptide repeat-containing protein [Chitinophaga costaii]|uniref:Tetratricopeptide repeat-containing protein n=1 Tax=Chitinophaga costaii TaxID=1335309 RepID=A0A1C4FVB2_9BACT|nr:tetratricopeptide repeat protein [Chitinophaga costaii]PUZ27242.1 tetratricopeptide repeat-containing protein [Chitinophaga costaii]SCC59812.1 Tetratricopeptide repeat-containing protein [Chitinophaga costaii]